MFHRHLWKFIRGLPYGREEWRCTKCGGYRTFDGMYPPKWRAE